MGHGLKIDTPGKNSRWLAAAAALQGSQLISSDALLLFFNQNKLGIWIKFWPTFQGYWRCWNHHYFSRIMISSGQNKSLSVHPWFIPISTNWLLRKLLSKTGLSTALLISFVKLTLCWHNFPLMCRLCPSFVRVQQRVKPVIVARLSISIAENNRIYCDVR